jgi:predicted dehydrogenase
VRYAVIGLGNIAQVAVLPAFEHARENSELCALISSDPAKLRELGKRYRVERTGSYDDIEKVLGGGAVDAAYVAVPNSHHRHMTERLAKMGLHVLCEKPMAMTIDDCQAMIGAAKDSGVKLMIGYRLHFEKANLEAIERIRNGEIGEPLLFSSVFAHQVRAGDIRTSDELGGGALFDLCVYCVNAARYLFRDEPEEVASFQLIGTDPRCPAVDATTTAIVRFPHHRVAQFVVSQGAADIAEYRVVGTKGHIRLDPAFEYAGELKSYLTRDGKTQEKTYPKSDQFAPELVYFSRCILENRTPEPSGEEGLADIRVLHAIIEAHRTRKAVHLPPFAKSTRPSSKQAMEKPPVPKIETVNAPSPSK